MTHEEHKKRIQAEYDDCLHGKGKHGVNGEMLNLIDFLKEANKDGISRETIDEWLLEVQRGLGLL